MVYSGTPLIRSSNLMRGSTVLLVSMFIYLLHLFNTGLGWPLDYHFVFNLCALFSLVLIVISLFLPKSIEKKRLPEESPNS